MTANLKTLASFNGADAASPYAGLIADSAGNLFGTALGGASGYGTVFEIARTGTGYSAPQVLASFDIDTNGADPYGGLIADSAGNLFGTTSRGGTSNDGSIFEIAKTPTGYSALQVLASFDGTNGTRPDASLITDGAGDLFGTTLYGGVSNEGTVFELAKTPTGYGALQVLASFDGTAGAYPAAGLFADSAGNLFGTTQGGASGYGTVFEIALTPTGYSAPQVLATFDGTNGANPGAGLTADSAGNLFGTTSGGGASNDGTAFEIARTSAGYDVLQVLASFDGTNGANPDSGVITDLAGNLFGTTANGGTAGDGTVFEIANTPAGYSAPKVLVSFDSATGAAPIGGLVADSTGHLFGTTEQGGTVFEIFGSGFVVAPPATATITAAGSTSTPSRSVMFDVTFSRSVTGVDASQFSLEQSGLAAVAIASVTPVAGSNGSDYTVTVATGPGAGSLALDLTGTAIRDLSGGKLAQTSFGTPISTIVGGNPYSVVTGTFTADGKTDVAVTDLSTPGTISILSSQADGTFAVVSTTNTNDQPLGLVTADVNGDGKADLVYTSYAGDYSSNPEPDGLQVLLGNGDGTFTAEPSIPTQQFPDTVAVADLNGDGRLDLAVSDNLGTGFESLLGKGDGTFTEHGFYPTGTSSTGLAIGDLDSDGIPDIVDANYFSDTISVLKGDGSGGFTTLATIDAPHGPEQLALADLNDDGRLDLIVASDKDGTVGIALGNGDGSFQPFQSSATGAKTLDVAVVDLNGDGKLDVLATAVHGGLSVLVNKGDGTFAAPVTYTTGGDAEFVATGEFTGSGYIDAVVTNGSGGAVELLPGQSFVHGPRVDVACYCRGTMIRTATGEVAVEDLAIGDRLVTASGANRPIKWIGTRSYAGRFANANPDVLPICFKAGSLGENRPRRELRVSPKHAMFLDGVLIPAEHLVNGVSIIPAERVDRVEYFHIELDSHDVILAEGALSETFVDDHSRGMFHNVHDFDALYPEADRVEARYCAPRVEEGFTLEAVRRRLRHLAGLETASPPGADRLLGFVERIEGDRIIGWAQSTRHPDAPVCLDVLVDGTLCAQVLAAGFRPDLLRAGIGEGSHGFEVLLPETGSHPAGRTITVARATDGAVLPILEAPPTAFRTLALAAA